MSPRPPAVQEVWERAVTEGIPARILSLYRADLHDVIAEELANSDGRRDSEH